MDRSSMLCDPEAFAGFLAGSTHGMEGECTHMPECLMLIIQRRDVTTGLWVDTVVRHSSWNAHLTVRRSCRRTGHDFRIIAAHSREVVWTALPGELGECCSLDDKCRKRKDYGFST